MLKVKNFMVFLKNGGLISIYADEYELVKIEDNLLYNFSINNNLVTIISKELVEKIENNYPSTYFILI